MVVTIKDFQEVLKNPQAHIDKIEELVQIANFEQRKEDGTQSIPDQVYDQLIECLKVLKPDSEVLQELWDFDSKELKEKGKYNTLLTHYPMKSINTVKNVKSITFLSFIQLLQGYNLSEIELFYAVKLNGHGVRIVYQDGVFVHASSRARHGSGNDLTKQMEVVLAKNNLLKLSNVPQGLVEIRGELVLPLDKLSKARTINPSIVSAFTAVSSLKKESGKPEEWALLDFVAYKIVSERPFIFETKEQEYLYLEERLGFEIPMYWVLPKYKVVELTDAIEQELVEIQNELEEVNYPYYMDGIVVEVNQRSEFNLLGGNIKYDFGNLALKIGKWSQDSYTGFIQCVTYTQGIQNFTPVAVVASKPFVAIFQYPGSEEEYKDFNTFILRYGDKVLFNTMDYIVNKEDLGVLTVSGNMVRNVPLYNVANILNNQLQVGSPISFNYGGEAGVVTVFENKEVVLQREE